MSEVVDRGGLDWVRGDLERLLAEARDALQAFATAPEEMAAAQACAAHLHQFHSTLQMLEVPTVVELADEMERLANALRDHLVVDVDDAIDELMGAILQMPTFLAASARSESVSGVRAVAGALRNARGAEPSTAARDTDFTPLMSTASPEALERFQRNDGQTTARRVRASYQQCLVGVLRNDEPTRTAVRLLKIVGALQRICRGTPHERLWWLFGAYLEAAHHVPGTLQRRGIPILRRIDHELRALAVGGATALARPVALDLAGQLLEHIVDYGVRSQRIEEVLSAFGLGERNDGIARVGREAVSNVARVLLEELAAIKDRLDLYVRSELRNIEDLDALREPLRRASATLSVTGLGALESIVAEQYGRIELAASQGRIGDDELMSMAEALMQVEEELRLLSGADSELGNTAEARRAVVREGRVGLEEVKQSIVDFIGAKWDHGLIEAVPALLRAVRGGLDMIDLTRAALLTDECRRYVEEELLNRRIVPDWEILDRLADAITSIDYYLERFVETRGRSDERVLDLAWECVESLGGRLGAALPGATGAEARYASFLPPIRKTKLNQAALDRIDAMSRTGESSGLDFAGVEQIAARAVLPEAEAAPSGDVSAHVSLDDALVDLGHDEIEHIDAAVVATAAEPYPAMGLSVARATDEPDQLAVHVTQGHVTQGQVTPGGVPTQAATLPPIEQPVDDEILPVFLEETGDVLDTIDSYLPQFVADLTDTAALKEIRRSFHTLKGSGRMVGALIIGELAWAIENLLNRVLEGNLPASQDHVELMRAARAAIPELRDAFAQGRRPAISVANIEAAAQRCASVAGQGDDEVALPIPASSAATSPAERPNLLVVFDSEAREQLEEIRGALKTARAGNAVSADLLRTAHTLRGGAATVRADALLAVADAWEHWLQTISTWTAPTLALAGETLAALREEIVRVPASDALPGTAALLARLSNAAAPITPPAAGMTRVVPASVAGAPATSASNPTHLSRAPGLLLDWVAGVDVEAALSSVREELAATAAQHDSPEVTEVALALVGVYDVLDLSAPPETSVIAALNAGHAALAVMLAGVANGESVAPAPTAMSALRAVEDKLIDALSFDDGAPPARPAPAVTAAATADAVAPPVDAVLAIAAAVQPAASSAQGLALLDLPADADRELLQIFQEEATELLEVLDQRIERWRNETTNHVHSEHVLRALHTLKGGARLAGLTGMGDETHEFEAKVQLVAGATRIEAAVFADLGARQDALARWLPLLRRALQEPPAVNASGADAAGKSAEDHSGNRAAQEMVRVPATLLERLVDLAGESAIARARIGEVIGELGHVVDEVATTARRVRDQVRRLEIETEAQVLYRRERVEKPEYAEFDPLEMDRYSQLQQLARGLTESASDLLDLHDTIRGRSRETDSLLAHQARLHTELQEGLMRTRMVPFSRLVPRLSRIVRQIGRELGKQVQLVVSAADGELDRSVLERMIPPLEHMLRNAVDHGIEPLAIRRGQGKPDTGSVQIRLQREASEIVIEISDDGAGIDTDLVRRKASSQGLMAMNARLTDREVLGFIFAPGFSTARSVTQISGRGVGMDVVAAEVKQLGGSIDLQSERHRGTRFTIRLPFTVSVNRALMVTIGDDLYAVPLNSIEGIVRAAPSDLAERFATEAPSFTYAGMDYRLAYLGSLLGREHLVRGDVSSLPVLLTRSGDEAMAVHVDAVQGSREIVVKTLGTQFAGVSGVSGATLLGDGSVVVILDLPGLVRRHVSGRDVVAAAAPAADNRGLCVMVVDDSVTVRKVTSRLLERQGMEVLVAKDGIEAVAQLQERRPDIMLLDIEMPRMDGFEVAQQVRRDDRFGNLPIIMISSRSGAKHRERARELGVNRFLGKPFQESELLASIRELTGHLIN